MNKFITQKIGALAGFSDEILKILASFDADVSDVRLALQISKNVPLADKILNLAPKGSRGKISLPQMSGAISKAWSL